VSKTALFQNGEEGYDYVENGYAQGDGAHDQSVVEFNFVNATDVSCGICAAVVPYSTLFSEHMQNEHPEFADYTLESVPMDEVGNWMFRNLTLLLFQSWAAQQYEQKPKKSSFPIYNNDPQRPIRSTRTLRRVSQIRVNTQSMGLDELEDALRKKMVEKMGRKIPVSLVDKQHARCGICNAVG
jgi:predicted molibdopterin-dependent oxidoreductase YjgC